ncbi:hypothetical protein BIY27_19725 [Gibbsiella quercinecans]|nr:hypothetical protein BIY27_19725 [Gibbsiella quercinecans]
MSSVKKNKIKMKVENHLKGNIISILNTCSSNKRERDVNIYIFKNVHMSYIENHFYENVISQDDYHEGKENRKVIYNKLTDKKRRT